MTMHSAGKYRILVRGHLDASLSDRVAGMAVSHGRRASGESTTVLVGRLSDQAALSGVLNTLYDLHLPVESVECMERENSNAASNSDQEPASGDGGARDS